MGHPVEVKIIKLRIYLTDLSKKLKLMLELMKVPNVKIIQKCMVQNVKIIQKCMVKCEYHTDDTPEEQKSVSSH